MINPFESSPGFRGFTPPGWKHHAFGLAIVVVLFGLGTSFQSVGQSVIGVFSCNPKMK
jgi:hypothetical protein